MVINTRSETTRAQRSNRRGDCDACQTRTIAVSIISWLSVLYVLNGRKVIVWIQYRYEMAKI